MANSRGWRQALCSSFVLIESSRFRQSERPFFWPADRLHAVPQHVDVGERSSAQKTQGFWPTADHAFEDQAMMSGVI
jgi:hypothetical protein